MTSDLIKFLSTALLFAAWIGLILAKHFWPDLNTDGIIFAITSTLAGLGVHTIGKAKQ
jgi:hypothetical protein